MGSSRAPRGSSLLETQGGGESQLLTSVLQPDEKRPKPIYTDTDMCDPNLRQEIERSVEDIHKLMGDFPFLPEDWELALELGKDDDTGENICSYYFVYHTTRCLFWLHEFDLEEVLGGVGGVTEKTHIRESTYATGIHRTEPMTRSGITSSVLVSNLHIVVTASWLKTSRSHWETFPHNREVPEPLIRELSGILLHAGIGMSGPVLDVLWLTSDLDCMTSPNSTTVYSEPDLKKLLSYVKHIKRVGGDFGFSACVVGESSVQYSIECSLWPFQVA